MFSGLFKKNVQTVQILSKITGGGSANTQEKKRVEHESSSDDEDADDTPEVSKIEDVHVDMGGGKGWPSGARALAYHNLQGMICAGTSSGSIFAFGSGFQYMRSAREDGMSVTHLIPLDPDMLFVAYSDNSIEILELPTLTVVGQLPASWIGAKNGSITAVHVDIPSERNYTYVGSSEGVLQVIDVTDSSVRVCDFLLNCKSVGLSQLMSVTDIALCPKDDKFMAIGYRGSAALLGAVVIYDLSKSKAHRLFETSAISSLVWSHLGDYVYVGTSSGALLQCGVEKSNISTVWNAKSELVNEDDDYDNDGEEGNCSIRSLCWLAPQPQTQDPCLFALLGNPGYDNDVLKNVMVGFLPSRTGELELVYALPSMSSEKVECMYLVPTYSKAEYELAMRQNHGSVVEEDDDDASSNDQGSTNTDSKVTVSPAMLLLSKRLVSSSSDSDEEDAAAISGAGKQFESTLKLIKFPNTDVASWALEIGTAPEPKLVEDVLPTENKLTFISGFASSNSALSLSKVLAIKSEQNGGKILPPSKPPMHFGAGKVAKHDSYNLRELEQELTDSEDCDLVLSTATYEDPISHRTGGRVQDTVFTGYEDGSLIGWRVSLPETSSSIWLPCVSLRCGDSPISCIYHDEASGLLLVGDKSGNIVVWEVYEDSSGMSASEVLRQVNVQATAVAKKIVEQRVSEWKANANANGPNGELDQSAEENEGGVDYEHSTSASDGAEFLMYSAYNFNNMREAVRSKLHNHITAALLIPEFNTIVVGTEDGTVYACLSFSAVLFSEIEGLDKFGASGSVIGFAYGNFLLEEKHNVPAIYISFASGHIVVVQLSNLCPLAFGPGLSGKHTSMAEEGEGYSGTHELCITDGKSERILKPSLKLAAVQIAEDEAVSAETSTPTPTASQISPIRDAVAKSGGFAPFGGLKFGQALQSSSDKTPEQTSMRVVRKRIPFRSIPRYIVMVVGRLLLTYDLHRFTRVATKSCLAGYAGKALITKVIAQKSMVATTFLNYSLDKDTNDAESDDGLDSSMLCAASVNAQGVLILVSVKHKALINQSQVVNEALDGAEVLEFGAIVPNGNCYLAGNCGRMIYSSATSLIKSGYRLHCPVPDRAGPDVSPPKSSLTLLHGREAQMAAQRSAARKRKSAIMMMAASTPFDLAKLFSKSREQRQRDDLLGNSEGGGDKKTSNVQATNSKVGKAISGLHETREAFEERGVKINRALVKADEMKESAQQYNKAVHEQKEALKKKNARWGLF